MNAWELKAVLYRQAYMKEHEYSPSCSWGRDHLSVCPPQFREVCRAKSSQGEQRSARQNGCLQVFWFTVFWTDLPGTPSWKLSSGDQLHLPRTELGSKQISDEKEKQTQNKTKIPHATHTPPPPRNFFAWILTIQNSQLFTLFACLW